MGRPTSLEERLGHHFADPSLLARALTHRSYINERPDAEGHNERLEFLGDAVVDLVAGHVLMERMPDASEGALSQARASVVREAGLARAARSLDLGAELRLGRGEEQTGGRDKPSLLANAFEALVGAVYLDGGFEAARALVARLVEPLLDEAVDLERRAGADPKTRLQEWTQARTGEMPLYEVVSEEGPDHERVFEVAVHVGGREVARGRGRSKKQAEQQAAERGLTALTGEEGEGG